MKKIYLIALIFSTIISSAYAQTISISDARSKPKGTVVTVKGIVTNGSELGVIRYIQDNTGGIGVYDSESKELSAVKRGDSITVTGEISPYANLTEIGNITSLVVNSTGNALPAPVVITPGQLSEQYECQLVQIKHAVFDNGGQTFAATSYSITADGESGVVFINNADQDMVGDMIPSVPTTLTGICSQHDFSNPDKGYQLLPRDKSDIQKESPIYFTKPVTNTAFTKTSMDFEWSTNITGTTGLFYGSTEAGVRTNVENGTGTGLDHAISLSGLDAGSIVWVQAFSVNGSDTAKSQVTSYATISNSTGKMKVYFNTPVDTKYSTGTDAIYVNKALDDSLIYYIDHAKYTIDMAIYNLNNNGLSDISQALIDAANRGVTVRVVGDGTTTNAGFYAFSGTNVHYIKRPTDIDGIMHNKFVVIDAQSSDPDDPIVWTGSMNFTQEQVDLDANNVIIIQDQSLAKAYQIEFEEMWGSTGATPDANNAKFGPEKSNNTPHHFIINGDSVECYFSPTDAVNSQIISHINTTNNDLEIATMLLTRTEIATAIKNANTDGANVNMLTNTESSNDAAVNTMLSDALGSHYIFYSSPGIMHNKYMIIDEGDVNSNPMVWTGSHNWSDRANTINDENSLVIHDATIANLYYQNFMYLYLTNGGVTAVKNFDANPVNQGINVYPNPVRNGNLTVSCDFSQNESSGKLQLVDMTGRTVFNRPVTLTNGTNKLSFKFPATYKGTYVIRLITAKHVWSKIVIFE